MTSQIIILDGGLGTSLEQKYHKTFDRSTPLWSSDLLITDPQTLTSCQKDFGNVPVDLILTASYQVSVEGFRNTKNAQYPDGVPAEEVSRYLDVAVRIAEDVTQSDAGVALSVGPYGAVMIPSQEYSGEYDEAHNSAASLEEWHQTRMEHFAKVPHLAQRVKFIALETVPRADEIIAMRKAISSTPQVSSLPYWISILSPGEVMKLPDGTEISEAVRLMLDPAITPKTPWGIGINCTKVHKLDALLRIYEATVANMVERGQVEAWPALVLYPDGTNGEVYNTTTQTWELPEGETADRRPWEEQLAEVVEATRQRGEWPTIVVGGCCRASHVDIKKLRSRLLG